MRSRLSTIFWFFGVFVFPISSFNTALVSSVFKGTSRNSISHRPLSSLLPLSKNYCQAAAALRKCQQSSTTEATLPVSAPQCSAGDIPDTRAKQAAQAPSSPRSADASRQQAQWAAAAEEVTSVKSPDAKRPCARIANLSCITATTNATSWRRTKLPAAVAGSPSSSTNDINRGPQQ